MISSINIAIILVVLAVAGTVWLVLFRRFIRIKGEIDTINAQLREKDQQLRRAILDFERTNREKHE